MSSYVISCCSTADLTKEHFAKKNISYICFHYELNGQQYADDLGQSMPFDQFYKAMQDGATTKTSQINADEFTEYFEGFLKEGKDILHVCLSSGITGVVNSANIAREELAEKYPDRKILIVDSLGASSGYGLLMDRLADLRDEGKTIEEVYQWAEAHKLNLHHWFFSTDLTFYIRGGRISKTSGFFGTMLNICPLLNMDDQGRLIPRYKIRTKKKVIRAIVDKMEEYAEGGLDYSGKCYISQSACIEDAREVARLVEERFPKFKHALIFRPGYTKIPACCFTAKENDHYEKKKNKGDKAAGENSTTGTFRYCYFRTSGSIRLEYAGNDPVYNAVLRNFSA